MAAENIRIILQPGRAGLLHEQLAGDHLFEQRFFVRKRAVVFAAPFNLSLEILDADFVGADFGQNGGRGSVWFAARGERNDRGERGNRSQPAIGRTQHLPSPKGLCPPAQLYHLIKKEKHSVNE